MMRHLHASLWLCALAATAGTLVSCTQHTIDVQPIEIRPIHMTLDINLRVDRELERFFEFEEELEPMPEPEPQAEPVPAPDPWQPTDALPSEMQPPDGEPEPEASGPMIDSMSSSPTSPLSNLPGRSQGVQL